MGRSSLLAHKLSLTLNRSITCNRRVEKWAAHVHPGVHTLGVASTQRVEGVNGVLKRVVYRTGSMVALDDAILGTVQDTVTRTEM